MTYIQLPTDATNTGKKIDTVTPDGTQHREICAIGSGPSTNVATVNSSGELLVKDAGFSTTVSVANTVTTQPNSTAWVKNAGFAVDTSNFLNIKDTPVSTTWVKLAGFAVDSSNYLLTNATFTGSTTVNVSSLAGLVDVAIWDSSNVRVKPGDSANNAVRVNIVANAAGSGIDTDDNSVAGGQSSIALTISETYGFDAVGGTNWLRIEASSKAPSTGATGLVVRQALNNLQSVASSNAFASSAFTVGSSNAAYRTKVYAYSITSTVAVGTKVQFYNGATLLWPIVLQAVSSGISGANLAVSPPAFLFQGSTGAAVTLNTPSSLAGFRVGVSFFQEP